jgi:hypothetical protein
MVGRKHLRFALFCLGSGALLAVGLGLRAEGDQRSAVTAVGRPSVQAVVGPRLGHGHVREERNLRRDARRFLSAFLRYEGGEVRESVSGALRVWSTRDFASELLEAPPRLHGRLPPARIDRLFIKEASWEPAIAVVGGVARRGQRSERFSFLFARSGGRWLAGGPAP